MKPNEYMDDIRDACGIKLIEPGGLYGGKEGHLRLARECGYALNDFSDKEQQDILKGSYSRIYVRACCLKPILNASEWVSEMEKGKNRSRQNMDL